jgi:uncharacterized protein (AIM24 family)
LTEFSYRGPAGTADSIAFAPDVPGQIIPIKLEDYGGKITCQKGSLLCSAFSVDISVEFSQNFKTGLAGGEGFILQGLRGHGYAFLVARGVIIQKTLRAGERLQVSTGHLVGFQNGVNYDCQLMDGGLGDMLFGGEGLFVTTLTGPGVVWLESVIVDRLVMRAKVKHAL